MSRCLKCLAVLSRRARYGLCKRCRCGPRPSRHCGCGRRLSPRNPADACHVCKKGAGIPSVPRNAPALPGHAERIARYAERAALGQDLFAEVP